MIQGLLITRDELLKRRLHSLMLRLGFGEVLCAADSRETLTRMRRLGAGLRFVLLDADGWEDSDKEWNEVIGTIEEPLRRLQIPMVIVGSSQRAILRSRIRPVGQLNYTYLKKPFSLAELNSAVARAGARLLSYSQPLLLFGKSVSPPLRDELSWFRTDFHPRFELATDLKNFIQKVENLNGGPAVVLLDPTTVGEEGNRWLRRFKMTAAGRRCKLVCISRASSEIAPLRRTAEIFWEPQGSWIPFVEQVARSMAQSLYCDLVAEQARREHLDEKVRRAKAVIASGLRADPMNLRLLAMVAEISSEQGKKNEAMKAYEQVLLWNPCLPQGYLGLWCITGAAERPGLMNEALKYCPAHPEIKSRSS